jgi:hypothetical protein
MKQIILFLSACIALNSCDYTTGSGHIVNQKRSVSSFTGISVGGSFDVEIKTGDSQQVEVEADDNIIKYVETSVSGGVLNINLEGMHSLNNVHLKVVITTPELASITASASADVKALDQLKGNGKISFEASSSAEIEAEVDAPSIFVDANSSGTVTLKGKTKDYKATVSSSGEIKTFDLLSENTNVEANSSGSAEVHASVHLKADASSSGSIEYKGGASVDKSESSSGSVDKKD